MYIKSKYRTIVWIFIFVSFVSACSQSDSKQKLSQSKLKEPSSIIIAKGDAEKTYRTSDSKYQEIFDIINQNWWKSPASAESWAMQDIDLPIKALCTFSQESLTETDILIIFQYDDPVIWDNPQSEPDFYEIHYYVFILPDNDQKYFDPIEGNMLISEDTDFFDKFNVYQYWYDNDLLFLSEEFF